jgi:hypothetical protein
MSELNSATRKVISIAQTLLVGAGDPGPATAALVAEKVSLAASLVPAAADGPVDTSAAIAELVRRYSLWIGQDTALSDSFDHVQWLVGGRKKDWRYWPRYRDMLEEQMSVTAVDAVDSSTDRILALLEDPSRSGSWDRRGLVVGHVQSGKTANYTGLVSKAADAGYKIIIVLAGLHNNLRAQTQIRLEEGFLGYETSATGDVVKLIGVGVNGRDFEIKPNCATNRSNNGDFNTRVARHLAISPEQRPWLFVLKKNKTVLERLLKWILAHAADAKDAATGRPFVSNLPLLLIDDEADHASVDTGEQFFDADGNPDEDHQPKAINSLIRRILHAFAKKAYVGYTATPFANIFIHRQNATAFEGPDLFPQSFIVNLAAPSNYIGPTRVFGLRTPEGRAGGLPLVRTFRDHACDDLLEGWMPLRHKKDHVPLYQGQDALPLSLRKAVHSFILAVAARDVRGQAARHSTMLVHVTRFTAVQKEVRRQVEAYVRGIRGRIIRNIDSKTVLDELQVLWDQDFVPACFDVAARDDGSDTPPFVPTWREIHDRLPDVLEDIDVREINGTAKDALDYAAQGAKGLRVIAIGGDKLARGLTLEGLCTSYFVRTTKMYDTLMQMGRWFGYRPGYLDLCRLFTTAELVEWFEHIADASEELREEFDLMADSGATPRDYGLRVESHSVLLVTSPLKMRTARTLQLSFSGESLETVSLHSDPTTIHRNLLATERLLGACGHQYEKDPVRQRPDSIDRWKGYLWSDVHWEAIVEFFESYVTNPKARKVDSALLRDFVKSMAAAGELTAWTVVLLDGGDGRPHVFSSGLRLEGMARRKADTDITDRYSIGRLISPRDEAIDLGVDAWRAALDLTRSTWKPDPARVRDGKRSGPPDSPNGPSIRRVRGEGGQGADPARERGLLLLYPLDPQESGLASMASQDGPVIAFGVSFPSSRSGVKVEYAVDHLRWAQEYGQVD